MAIPNYQDFMNPVLTIYAKSGDAIKRTDIVESVADLMRISADDRMQTVKSGETVISTRVHWAAYFLFRAGLLERVDRGLYKITAEGRKIEKSKAKITDEFLRKYPSFVEFMNSSNPSAKHKKQKTSEKESDLHIETDPEEMLETAINGLNSVLEDDILSKLKTIDPKRFEQIVVDLMESMDYGVGSVTRYVADGGVDGIIDEDELGLSKIYLQAKRYAESKVPEKEMRDFVGAMATNNVSKGVFITTSDFSDRAINAAEKSHGYKIILINGKKLAELMRKHGLGAKPKKNYDIKEFDASYFEFA